MSSLRQRVAAFQVAPKYNICIGEDNADLLIGLISDELSDIRIEELERELASRDNERTYEHK